MGLLGKEYLILEHKAYKVPRVFKVLRVVKVLLVRIQM